MPSTISFDNSSTPFYEKKKSEQIKSIGQQYINDVYVVPEFHFQSQLELYPF